MNIFHFSNSGSRFRDECDMRKLLISDMNDLRHQYEDMKRIAGQGAIDDDEDPVRLKIALQVLILQILSVKSNKWVGMTETL